MSVISNDFVAIIIIKASIAFSMYFLFISLYSEGTYKFGLYCRMIDSLLWSIYIILFWTLMIASFVKLRHPLLL